MVLSRAEKRRQKKKGIAIATHDSATPKPDISKSSSVDDELQNKKRKRTSDDPEIKQTPKKHRRKRKRVNNRNGEKNSDEIIPTTISTMDKISKGNISVTTSWLNPKILSRIKADAIALRAAGAFTKSAIGGREGESQTMELRKRYSECCGLFDDAVAAKGVGDIRIRDALLDVIADLREDLSETIQPLADYMELQYLYYPGGGQGFYGKHIDQQHRIRGKVNRVVSMVLYLNDLDWDSTVDGGSLRAYPHKCPPIDVEPCGGTLVLFDSGKLLHEARPTQRERYALVGWFMAKE